MSIASASSGRRFRLNRLVWTKKRGEVGRNLGFSCLFFSLKGTPHPHLTLIRSSPAIGKKITRFFLKKRKERDTWKRWQQRRGRRRRRCRLLLIRFRCVPVPLRSGTVWNWNAEVAVLSWPAHVVTGPFNTRRPTAGARSERPQLRPNS